MSSVNQFILHIQFTLEKHCWKRYGKREHYFKSLSLKVYVLPSIYGCFEYANLPVLIAHGLSIHNGPFCGFQKCQFMAYNKLILSEL